MVTTSFLMMDGHVRNLQGHIERLMSAAPATSQFLDRIVSQLRETPGKVQASITVESNHYNVELRPPRNLNSLVTIDAHGHRDERRHPEIKGLDKAWQNTATASSRRQGADEGLLVDESGQVIMAINASLLAIKGDTVFHSTHPRSLPSVLEPLIIQYLQAQGCHAKPREQGFNINDLRSSEVWLVDSLAGIRQVHAWIEYGSKFLVPEVRPVAAFVPTFSEVNDYLWKTAQQV
ncbi:class IV aminotransferase [Corynebacterium suranareeae]|uniref:Class IV aminotransferase n=1 Tax=Corynebacterium suranareeae TaxID=2506452 RepID=A0A160PQE8_9CORY|nr:aminotransferase class IV [Corynebacterium suranareeae]BAU95203.1 class IV aminotransferase [Corynebacterium suranareeae]